MFCLHFKMKYRNNTCGLGEVPEAQLIVKTDKLNYDASDVAQMLLWSPSATVH